MTTIITITDTHINIVVQITEKDYVGTHSIPIEVKKDSHAEIISDYRVEISTYISTLTYLSNQSS